MPVFVLFVRISAVCWEVMPVLAVFAVIALAWAVVIPTFAVFAVIAFAWVIVMPVLAVFVAISLVCVSKALCHPSTWAISRWSLPIVGCLPSSAVSIASISVIAVAKSSIPVIERCDVFVETLSMYYCERNWSVTLRFFISA